jgi:hypothetical protein
VYSNSEESEQSSEMFELERNPGNVQRQKEKEKTKKQMKDDILGFGFTFVFYLFLSPLKKNTLRSQESVPTSNLFFTGETSSKGEIRNSAKKSFSRFSVARSEGEKKRCKNRHIHVICFHSAAKNREG